MGCPAETEIGDNLVFSVTTHDPDTGVLTDADAVPDYRVYEDETGTAILTGSMAKLDDANTTGFYSESIACTSGNGFENGKSYTIYIVATVDSDQGGISFGFKAYDRRKADATAISADTTAADNLELFTEISNITSFAVDANGRVDVSLIEGSDATDQIGDAVLTRGVSNVEDTADATSLAALVLAAFESAISSTTWTIYKTDHSTTFTTRTVTTDSSAEAIVEVT
jgi:hypothetical protein